MGRLHEDFNWGTIIVERKQDSENQVQDGNKNAQHMDIAIIGVGLKIADKDTLSGYWDIFKDSIDCIREMPDHRKDQIRDYAKVFLGDELEPKYYKGTYLENLDEFDYEFFKISPREAQVMDPAQRLLLETVCETFDNAGYPAKTIKGSKTGIFIGYSSGSFKDNYLMDISFRHPELMKYSMVGNMPAVLPARASHVLDLKGPSLVLDTACSSSLVAINQACDSLKSHTSTMAIAGGVKLNLLPLITQDTKLGFESDDDKTRTFDAGASGTSIGEGVGCILLKPLEQAEKDHDYIYAVIKGISVNHDGTAMGITAPNPVAQTNVILDALKDADIHPDEIDYIETHGTATILGDPIEFQGLNNAFGMHTKRKQFCALSASKSNLGHLYECASIAATIKAVAALQYKKIPGMKNFMQPNMIIGFCNSPFYINQYTKDWEVAEGKLRTCAVSAFGISGTNCHMILQEYPKKEEKSKARPADILCISAKSKESLLKLIKQYEDCFCDETIDFERLVLNVNKNKMHYQLRMAIVFENRQELLHKLKCIQSIDELTQGENQRDIYYSNLDSRAQSGMVAVSYEDLVQDCNEMLLEYTNEIEQEELKHDILRSFREIALNYINGAEIDWKLLYQGFCQDRVVLPHYPFKKSHLWLPETKLQPKKDSIDSEIKMKTIMKEELLDKPVSQREQLHYQRVFLEKEADNENCNIQDCLLIQLSGNVQHTFGKQLEAAFHKVINLDIDEKMLKVINTENYFLQLYRNVDFSTISHVVYSGFMNQEGVKSVSQLRYYQKVSLLGLTHLYRCLNASLWKKNNITVVSLIPYSFRVTGEERLLKPEGAAIFGFGKALNREFKNIHFYCIDFDENTGCERIVQEITRKHSLDIVCYRNNKRYVEGLTEVELPEVEKASIIRDGGIYLITGGASGIGFETSMELLRRAENVTLILVNRTALPDQSRWETILQENQEQSAIKRIKKIMELQKYAKCVEYYACDIADQDALQVVIETVNQVHGKINGIFHAAGIGGGTSLAGLNEERIMGMIQPKIFGTYILDHATRNQNLDFFVMYSSISTIFSSSDLADYAAGNIYMDAYCEYRKMTQPGISLTVNWATWSETGMSVEHNFTMDTLFKSIKTKTGIKGLFAALSNGSGNLVVGELNLTSQIGLLMKRYPMEFSSYIQKNIRQLEEKQKKDQEEAAQQSKSDTGEYGLVERQLCGVCCKVLGYEEINIFDNFFELGADSIMLGYIFNEVDAIYPQLLQITDLFSHPTVKSLAEYILEIGGVAVTGQEEENALNQENPVEAVYGENSDAEKEKKQEEINSNDVAIIGIGMNLPNAGNLEEYWELLINGINAIREIPEEHKTEVENHIRYQHKLSEHIKFRKCAYLDEINKFDYVYFGMSPRESSLIDPANRLFLQCCATAIDDAGYGKNGIRGTNTGVFLGYSANIGSAYSRLLYETDQELFNASLPLNQISMCASKVAYLFDLKGPSMVIDTACSSSLVSIHMACEQIRNGDCEMALAGGVSLALAPVADKFSVGFESQEEKTRAFADQSTGAAVGEGVGVVLLKSLKQAVADGDDIYSVIKGSAINQDGSSFGIAAPNYLAQSEAIQKAWENAGVTPYDISYIEAHGTGTPLGDPIEVKGITHAYETITKDRQLCGIGSLKTNIGHLNEASGISGIIKLVLMLRYKMIPPSLNLNVPNRNINFLESPLYVVTRPTKLMPKNKKIIIGINGFGMSGTNGHLIMEEAPAIEQHRKADKNEPYVFTITAKSTSALKNLLVRYQDFVRKTRVQDYGNLCYNVNIGRYHYNYRIAFTFENREELLYKLEQISSNYPFEVPISECYIGQFAIVPENKTNRYDHEITLKEQNDLTAKANLSIIKYKESGEQKDLLTILECYIKGAEIAWQKLFSGIYTKMHLPTYPYDKLHSWYKVPELEEISEEEIKLDSYYYEKKWVLGDAVASSKLKSGDAVVIFHGQGGILEGLPEQLLSKGIEVINLYQGDNYRKEDDNNYYSISEVNSYQSFFHEIQNRNVKMLLHGSSFFRSSSESSDDITKKLEAGFYDLIFIIKAMSKAHFNHKIELTILSNNAYLIQGEEKYLIPENAALLSLGKVIEQENTNINCRAIDMDLNTSMECISQELQVDTHLYMVGYRNNTRYVEEMDEADIDVTNENLLKDQGVYVITGGTDGIGLETARYISRQISGHLILLSRKGFPEEASWGSLKNEEKLRHKIQAFEEIKSNECTVMIKSCDVGDYNSVEKVLKEVRDKFGKINGIVHSAGISGAGYILRKERESFQSVFHPKIYGVWNLDRLTLMDNLDFMLVYSSAVTDSGEAGQSDYVAANSYLDAFTDYRNHMGRRTLTVNWVSWKETGMSVVHGINVDSATKAITTQEGIMALDGFIKSSKHRVTIGQFNVDDNFLAMSAYSKNQASPRFAAKIAALRERRQNRQDISRLSDGNRDYAQIKNGKLIFIPKSEKASKVKNTNVNVTLVGDYTNQYKTTERVIASIYSSILGYDEINVFDNFFEMGGDSVMLSEMHDLIDEKYPEYLTIADLFEYTSVRTLSEYIDSKQMTLKIAEVAEDVAITEEAISESRVTQYEASEAQKRVYFDSRLNANKLMYNNPFISDISEFEGNLEEVINRIIERHEILRTKFQIIDSKLMQNVLPELKIEIDYISVMDVDSINYSSYLRTFDYKKAPLFHATVFLGPAKEKILLFDVHHILLDGYSASMFQDEMLQLALGKPVEEPKGQYRDYVAFESNFRESNEYKNMETYWQNRLADYDDSLEIQPTNKVISYDASEGMLEVGLTEKLKERSKQLNISLFSVFYSAFALALSMESRKRDIVILVPALNRYRPRFKKIMGLFVNLLPIRSCIDDGTLLSEYLIQTAKNIEKDISNQFCDYNRIIQLWKASKHNRLPNFYYYFDFEDQSIKKIKDKKEMSINQTIAKNHIDFNIKSYNGVFQMEVSYKANLYGKDQIENIIDNFKKILLQYTEDERMKECLGQMKAELHPLVIIHQDENDE